MYKAVAHFVLLYGSESWMVTRDMLKVLTAFHYQAARRITGKTEKCGSGEKWEYPVVEEVMDSAGLHSIIVYIKRRQMTIAERVACWIVYALCPEV